MLDEYPDVLTTKDIQSILRIGRSKAYRLLRSKKIPCILVGNSYRISKRDVVNMICYNNTYAVCCRD